MVLLLLVVMWVGAGVYYFRGRPESRGADSIGSFRHQLRVLERTSPTLIDPAHRLRDRDLFPMPVERRFVGATGSLSHALSSTPSMGALRRRQTLKRRRDVFFGLILGVVGSFVLGLLPGLGVMWLLAAALLVALLGYVALLVQIRNRAAERATKVRFLPDAGAVSDATLLLRRSAN